MQINPAQEWQQLAENYREMFDGQLEELAQSFDDLTPTAREVLRNELKNRGLAAPGERAVRPSPPPRPEPAQSHWESAVDQDAMTSEGGQEQNAEGEGDHSERDYTWKTLLCECGSTEQALQLQEILRRAGIDSWMEAPRSYDLELAGPRVVVAADQLEEARAIAAQPIPQDLIDQFSQEAAEYVPPPCPACGAEDPVLESAEPTNSWLCEACGKQWTEPELKDCQGA